MIDSVIIKFASALIIKRGTIREITFANLLFFSMQNFFARAYVKLFERSIAIRFFKLFQNRFRLFKIHYVVRGAAESQLLL